MARLAPPLHREAAERLRRELRAGRFAVGGRIPPEPELCRALGVSRNTVRQAVDKLVVEGVLDRQQGRGTFVRALPSVDPALVSPPPTQDWAFRQVEHGWRAASPDLSNLFGLPPDGGVFHMTRVRVDGEVPVAIKRYCAPADLFAGKPPTEEELRSAPFDALLLARGVRFIRMNLKARPARLAAPDAEVLRAKADDLALVTERIGFNAHGRAVRLSETVMAGANASLFWSIGGRHGEALSVSTWTTAAFA